MDFFNEAFSVLHTNLIKAFILYMSAFKAISKAHYMA